MLKYLLSFLFILLMLSPSSFASSKSDEAKLKAEYGPELIQVPYFLRFSYNQKYHHDWKKTYYSDRKSFLLAYEADTARDKAKERAEARAQAEKDKQSRLEERAELKKQKDRIKSQLARDKAEADADRERQKEFDKTVSDQQKEIREMQRQAEQNR